MTIQLTARPAASTSAVSEIATLRGAPRGALGRALCMARNADLALPGSSLPTPQPRCDLADGLSAADSGAARAVLRDIALLDPALRLERAGLEAVLEAMAIKLADDGTPADALPRLRAARRLLQDCDPQLDARQTRLVHAALQALRQALPDGAARWLTEALLLQCVAAHDQQSVAEAQPALTDRLQAFEQPGARKDRRLGVRGGITLGLPGAASVRFELGVAHTDSLSGDDEGRPYGERRLAVHAGAGAASGLTGVARLSAGARVTLSAAETCSATDARTLAAIEAPAHQRNRGRLLGPGGSGDASALQEALLHRADFAQRRLETLLRAFGLALVPQDFAAHRPPRPATGFARGVEVTGSADVRLGSGSAPGAASVAIGASRAGQTNYSPKVSSFLEKQLAGAGLARLQDVAAERRALLAGRLAQLARAELGDPELNVFVRALQRSGGTGWLFPRDRLLALAERCEGAFRQFAELAQQCEQDNKAAAGWAAKMMRRRLDDWGVSSPEELLGRFAVLAALIAAQLQGHFGVEPCRQAHETVRGLPAVPDDPALAALSPLERQLLRLDRLDATLRRPPFAVDGERLARETGFLELGISHSDERKFRLDLGGRLGPLAGRIGATVTLRERRHADPLRAGDYLELALETGATVSTDVLGKALSRALGQTLPEAAGQLLARIDLDPAASAGAGKIVTYRFFRPQWSLPGQDYRYQTVRTVERSEQGGALSAGVPLQPGLQLALGGEAVFGVTTAGPDVFSGLDVSWPVQQYFAHRQDDPARFWPALCQAQQPAFERLIGQLSRPDTPAGADFRHLLQALPDEVRAAFEQAMRNHAADGVFAPAFAGFVATLEALYPLWKRQKDERAAAMAAEAGPDGSLWVPAAPALAPVTADAWAASPETAL